MNTNVPKMRWQASLALLAAGAAAFFAFSASPAGAATLANVSWTVTNNQVAATNVTYAYSFKTATAGTIAKITFVVSGTGLGAGTLAINRNFGIGAGTVSRSGQTITYTVTTPAAVAAGIPIYIEFSGLTNSPTAGSYTTAITTQTAAPATIDSATTPTVALASNNTAVTVAVAKSLTFTSSAQAFELDMDPSLPALADQSATVALTVLTNANSGYTLAVSDSATGLQSSGSGNPTISKVSTGKASSLAWPGAPNWGYTVTGTGATIDSAFSGSKYAGYTSGGETIATRSSSTGATADTINIATRVALDYTVPSGIYSDVLTYTVTPNYN
jgi:hypothetical protein